MFSVEHDKKCDNGKHKDYSKELEEGSDTDDSNSDAYESDDTFAPGIRRNYQGLAQRVSLGSIADC